ncbi:MAG: O-antigen ligase family protein [Candidatus Nanopelagicales bacterium]
MGEVASRSNIVLGWLSVYLLFLFAIPSRLIIGPLGSAGAPSMLFGLASMLAWFLAQVRSRPDSQSVRKSSLPSRRPIRLAFALFLVSIAVSYTGAMLRPIDQDEISPADVAVIVAFSWAGIFLTAQDGLARLRDVELLARRMAFFGGLMALIGLAQFVTKQALVDVISVPGLNSTYDADVFYRNGVVRIVGTATHPIEYGALLTILLPIALHSALQTGTRGLIRRWFPVVTIALALAVSMSRSAYVSLAVAVGVLLVGWPPRLRLRLGGAIIGVSMLLALTVPGLLGGIRGMFVTASDDPSILSRTDSYEMAMEFVARWPWVGRGYGTFLPKFRIFDNTYLGVLVSGGTLGFVTFVAIPVTAITVLILRRRRWVDERSRDLALALAASIAAGAASLAFFDGFAFPMTMGTYVLTLGISGALVRVHDSPEPPGDPPAADPRERP